MRGFISLQPFIGYRIPTADGTYAAALSVPFFIHLIVMVTVAINAILWPIVGVVVAWRVLA
jgi:phosphotransferase system  glucose/maltose/N-acetylglucosamine-specific IIC component